MKIVTVEQMIELERRSADVGAPPDFLMENAGLATADYARDLLGDIKDRSVMILIGPGNNGGDGLVAARHLHDWGAKVHLFMVKRKTENDKNFALDMKRNIPWIDALAEENWTTFKGILSSTDLFVDSLFGTGKIRPFEGLLKKLLATVVKEKSSRPAMKILAVDLPSGMNADTGDVDPVTLTADLTVTFACPKIGLFEFPGAANIGKLEVADIQIPEYLSDHINTELITAAMIRSLLPQRPLNANKGTFGKLLVVAGSINYVGAAYLACEGAMRVGTGLVTLATPKSVQPMIANRLAEVTHLPLGEFSGFINAEAISTIEDQIQNYDAVLLGCGLGQHTDTKAFVEKLISSDELTRKPIVIDADGLNILAEIDKWPNLGQAILTPHSGEMARLTDKTVSEIQENRSETALEFAAKWNQTVVLKGAFTVIASPEGKARICGVANPGLASAGTGDVLAGAIAGFVAQGLPAFDAATCGVYLHAMAGELVKAEIGDTGMIATDLLIALPIVIKELKEEDF